MNAFNTNDKVALTNDYFNFKSGRKVRKGTKGTIVSVQLDAVGPVYTVRCSTGATLVLREGILRNA